MKLLHIYSVIFSLWITTMFSYINIQANNPETYVLAGSDYQGESVKQSEIQVKEILSSMKQDGYTSIDGFLFAGDYTILLNQNAQDSNEGIHSLTKLIQEEFPSLERDDMILLQGNHDQSSTSEKIDNNKSGMYEFKDYCVFVINETDYRWQDQGDDSPYYENVAKNTAENLRVSLEKKVYEKYSKPIFVMSHLPLHVTMRTNAYGDGEFGKYIFDVLQEFGDVGLNLFFLYGHNHSSGCENYLGGAAVFLKQGDTLCVPVLGAKENQIEDEILYTEETLNFTYLNAGYVGYFTGEKNCDSCLTMTLFTITDEEVTICRYSKDGVHDLKSKGEHANQYPEVDNTIVYPSAQVIPLNRVDGEDWIVHQDSYQNIIHIVVENIKKIGMLI